MQNFEVAALMLGKVLSFFSHHRTDPRWSLAHSCVCFEMLFHTSKKALKERVLLIYPVLVPFIACQIADFNASIKKTKRITKHQRTEQ